MNKQVLLWFLSLAIDSSSTTSSASPVPNNYDNLEGGGYPGKFFLFNALKYKNGCFVQLQMHSLFTLTSDSNHEVFKKEIINSDIHLS